MTNRRIATGVARPSVGHGGRLPALLALMAAALAGCGPTSTTTNADGTQVRHYFGYVRIEGRAPSAEVTIQRVSLTTVGMRVRDGLGLGYFDEDRVYAAPSCRIVVLVRTDEQLREAFNQVARLERGDVCAEKFD